MSIITRPGFRVAKCGHEYATGHKAGRQRLVGDCDCTPPKRAPQKYVPKTPDLKTIECAHCFELFTTTRRRKYCTKVCSNKAIYRRRKEEGRIWRGECSVEGCGKEVAQSWLCSMHLNRMQSWGSLDRPPKSQCEACGESFQPKSKGAKYCSKRCNRKHYGSSSKSGKTCTIGRCSRPLQARGMCSMHYKRWGRAEGRWKVEPWSDRRRANYHKRRALKRQLPADDISHEFVYERDGWVCGICNEPVDKKLVWPDPRSKSLDHVKPLSKGGHHVLSNVQLAHLECNVRKGDEFSLEVDEMSA